MSRSLEGYIDLEHRGEFSVIVFHRYGGGRTEFVVGRPDWKQDHIDWAESRHPSNPYGRARIGRQPSTGDLILPLWELLPDPPKPPESEDHIIRSEN